MDFHDKDFFDRLMALTEENNHLLRKMVRSARWAMITRTVYWVFLIGASIGAYYLIQPYVDFLLSTATDLQDSIGSFNSLLGS